MVRKGHVALGPREDVTEVEGYGAGARKVWLTLLGVRVVELHRRVILVKARRSGSP